MAASEERSRTAALRDFIFHSQQTTANVSEQDPHASTSKCLEEVDSIVSALVTPPKKLYLRKHRVRGQCFGEGSSSEEGLRETITALLADYDQSQRRMKLLTYESVGLSDVFSIEYDEETASLEEKKWEDQLVSLLSERKNYTAEVDMRCAESVCRGSDVFLPGILKYPPNLQLGDVILVKIDQEARARATLDIVAIGKAQISSNTFHKRILQPKHLRKGLAISILEVFEQTGSQFKRLDRSPNLCQLFSSLNSENAEVSCHSRGSLTVPHVVLQKAAMMAQTKKLGESTSRNVLKVLDMCAAPGYKTSHLADLLSAEGIPAMIYAADKSKSRLLKLMKNCSKYISFQATEEVNSSKIPGVEVVPLHMDSSRQDETKVEEGASNSKGCPKAPPQLSAKDIRRMEHVVNQEVRAKIKAKLTVMSAKNDNSSITSTKNEQERERERILASFPDEYAQIYELKLNSELEKRNTKVSLNQSLQRCLLQFKKQCTAFDIILVDAPCSCFGLRPRLDFSLVDHSSEQQAFRTTVQRDLLKTAGRRTRVGGFIIYSTCTIFAEENQELVMSFLRANSEQFRLLSPEVGATCASSARPGSSLQGKQLTAQQAQQLMDSGDESELWLNIRPNDRVLDTSGFFIAVLQKVSSA